MSYGQSSYGGGEYGSTQTVVLPERIELPAQAVTTALHAPTMHVGGLLKVPILSIITEIHAPAMHVGGRLELPAISIATEIHAPAMRGSAVPIARHVRQMRVGQRE